MKTRSLVYLYLVAESDCRSLIQALRADGWHIQVAADIEQATRIVQQEGVGLGVIHFGETLDNDAPERLERLMQLTPATEWIGITSPEQLMKLIDTGLIPGYFHDYHTEPVDPLRLLQCLGHAYGMADASRHANRVQHRHACSADMIGVSERMQQVFRQIGKIASVDASVMISGSSGTGKELAAQAIHNRSARSKGPFVTINCGAISPTLIHSELFGHERGSFTGAHRRKIGRLEAADGGSIFLDEIADLPLDLQVNLLRFLQERTIERVGGMESIPLDVRVITASHVDLREAVEKGHFREDLFYRLNVVQLRMPDLRERVEDIEPLARYFFSIFAKERNHNVCGFSQQALQAMRDYSWPGNVRELINRIRRATIMCEHRLITPQELELPHPAQELATETLAQVRIEAERLAILAGLRQSSNNVSEAARRLGVARMTLYRLMQKHRINASDCDRKHLEISAGFSKFPHAHPMPIASKTGDSR